MRKCDTKCVTMTPKTPLYLTKNRLGIYLFQARIPKHLRLNQSLFRISLRTRDKNEALSKARWIKCMFDDLANRFFSSPEEFASAMRLLTLYKTKPDHRVWLSVEEFLMQLEPDEDELLTRAIKYDNLLTRSDSIKHASNETLSEISKKLDRISEHHTRIDSKPLTQLVNDFLSERQKQWEAHNVDKNTKGLLPKLNLFIEVIGDIESSQLQPSHSVKFKQALLSLPKNRKKGMYKNLSIEEIINANIESSEKMANETIKSYLGRVSTFLNWLSRNNYAMDKLSLPLQNVTKNTTAAHEERPPYNDDELKRLFNSHQYLQGTHKQASHYWVPLLALFTGARQNELCQLYKNDIYQDSETGIWVIDINQKTSDKSLKKPNHARLVPIHKQLKKLGFLGYVKAVTNERLFPCLPFTHNKYGHKLSRWYNYTYTNTKNCNIRRTDGNNPTFHSFRHTVETQLDHKHGVQPHQIAHLVGQNPPGKSETTNRYIKPLELKDREKVINKLSFPSIDFDQIRIWKG